MLRDVPPSRVAVTPYNGCWSASNDNEHLAKRQSALNTASLTWRGEPVFSRYNGPTTPCFRRGDEIWLNLDQAL